MKRISEAYLLTPESSRSIERYGSLAGPVSLKGIATYLPKGSFVVVRPHPESPWPEVAGVIEMLWGRVVNAPIALWPDCVGRHGAVAFAAAARLLGVRIVIWRYDPPADSIRKASTDLTDWPQTVLRWVRSRGATVPPEQGVLLERLAESSGHYRTFSQLAAVGGPAQTQWRRRFQAAGLGSPGRWHAVLRAVRIAVAIQAEPEKPIAEFAETFGFSGASALSDRLNDVIGARPVFLRGHLGGLWMLADAVKRSGIM